MASKPSAATRAPPHHRDADAHHAAVPCMGSGGRTPPGPHACVGSTLPTESPPWPSHASRDSQPFSTAAGKSQGSGCWVERRPLSLAVQSCDACLGVTAAVPRRGCVRCACGAFHEAFCVSCVSTGTVHINTEDTLSAFVAPIVVLRVGVEILISGYK